MANGIDSIAIGNSRYISQNGLMFSPRHVNASPIYNALAPHGFASGGTESIVFSNRGVKYRVHDFTTSSTFNTFTPTPMEFVLLAGGGGGGSGPGGTYGELGGSGGCGGVRWSFSDEGIVSTGERIPPTSSNSVTVGYAGGGGNWGSRGGDGGNSTLWAGLSTSGGGGGARGYSLEGGSSGGNGGGGGQQSGSYGPGGSGNTGGYSPSEGNNGTNGSGGCLGALFYSIKGNGSSTSFPGEGYGGGGGGGYLTILATPGTSGRIVVRYVVA
ncbi:hypothetical protein EB001_05640 [bacterium]|nr:hypothetical protein [bacterium]